jgi:ParB family chromosome partitioning protein
MTKAKSSKKKSRGANKAVAAVGVFQQIPLSKLRLSPRNVRSAADREQDQEGLAALAESIAHVGIIQNLVVTAQDDGFYDVEAGGRRLAASEMLVAAKRLSADTPVNCLVVPLEQALTASLTENTLRKEMNPVDEYLAFQKLIGAGQSVEDVAAAFGVTPAVVRRRLKLANVSPRILDDFRTGEVTLEQLMVLAIVDDHGQQEAAFYEGPEWQRHPHHLKHALTQDKLPGTHPLVRFISLAAYEAAGGVVERDLFANEGEGEFVPDLALVDKLVREKLAPVAQAALAAGWAWAEVVPAMRRSDLHHYDRAEYEGREPTEEEDARLHAIAARNQEIEHLLYGDEELDEEVSEQLEEEQGTLAQERAELLASFITFDDSVKAKAGCVVAVGSNGRELVYYGLIRQSEEDSADDADADAQDELLPAQVSGTGKRPKGLVSEKLAMRLTAHRTMALQINMADQPHVALAVVVHGLLMQVLFHDYWNKLPVGLRLEMPGNLDSAAPEIADTPAAIGLDAILKERTRTLPRKSSSEELLVALIALPQDELVGLLAVCTAKGINAIKGDDNYPKADILARALKLDMRQWWSATADSFFNHVAKPAILETVQAVAPAQLAGLDKLKKGELAKEAERIVAGSGWLPAILLTPPTPAEADPEDCLDADSDDELDDQEEDEAA